MTIIHNELKRLGIKAQVQWFDKEFTICQITFNSQEDLNLYRMIGNYKEGGIFRFMVLNDKK